MWVLIAHDFKVYLFKEGYMRTSSYRYDLSQSKIHDLNIHLTNNAVQKHNDDYGRYEEGNQLGFEYLRRLIKDENKSYDKIMEQI